MPPIPAKLADAIETTDGYGVVRGTTQDEISYVLHGRGSVGESKDKVTLAAVGDVFATDYNFGVLDRYAGEVGDGQYSFVPYYQATGDTLRGYDIRFVNQETVCADEKYQWGYSGYPTFNTPPASIDAIAEEGFHVVNFNSNHTWDIGEFGIEKSHLAFDEHPELMVVGSYKSDEDRESVRLIERNGKTLAFLSFCYGDNTYGTDPKNFPNQYYTCEFDKDRMAEDIERAKKVADGVVVYMHWGTEYESEPDEQEVEYAKFLADQDVDLVIASHAHILQPVRYVTGDSGNTVPVVYGLSDWITGWVKTDYILSGMFTCDFTWDDEGELTVDNLAFYPAIEWSDSEDGDVYVRFLKDMTDEEINQNARTQDVEDDVEHIEKFLDGLGMEIPVIWR